MKTVAMTLLILPVVASCKVAGSPGDTAAIPPSGLGLPDRDYYFRDDDRSKSIRDAYVAHVRTMLVLAGDPAPAAEAGARTVMALETALAKASKTRIELRDPEANYHKLSE